MSTKAAIGIDPGATTGVAYLRGDSTLYRLDSYAWKELGAYDIYSSICETAAGWVDETRLLIHGRESIVIGIELPTGGSYNRESAQSWSYARGLGKNIERAQELIRLFRADDWNVVEIAPRHKWTKWSRVKFDGYFEWGASSNEHSRDAALHGVRALRMAKEGEMLEERNADDS